MKALCAMGRWRDVVKAKAFYPVICRHGGGQKTSRRMAGRNRELVVALHDMQPDTPKEMA